MDCKSSELGSVTCRYIFKAHMLHLCIVMSSVSVPKRRKDRASLFFHEEIDGSCHCGVNHAGCAMAGSYWSYVMLHVLFVRVTPVRMAPCRSTDAKPSNVYVSCIHVYSMLTHARIQRPGASERLAQCIDHSVVRGRRQLLYKLNVQPTCTRSLLSPCSQLFFRIVSSLSL